MSFVHALRELPLTRWFARVTEGRRLLAALVIIIAASIALTGVSIGMYYANGFFRYDLSRPDYAKERSEIAKPEAPKNYDTTSPVTKKSINDFLSEFDSRQKDLRAYGDFRDSSLSDDDLQIVPNTLEQPQ